MTTLHPPRNLMNEQPPASPHSSGHSAGLHGEDRPYQSDDGFFSPSCLVSTSVLPPSSPAAPPGVEQQGKLVLKMPPPQPSYPSFHEERQGKLVLRTPQPRLGHLATIGYCQPGAQAVLRALLHQEHFLLIDIRLTPWSYYPEWHGSALAHQFTPQYRHIPELGNRHENDASLPIDLQNVQAGLRHLLPLLDAGRSCVLLCGCYAWQYCHRSLVADLLQRARPALSVSHLSSLVAPAQTIEVEARSRGELGLSLDLTLTHALRGEAEEQQQQQQQETILVTPLTLSVTVPGRGITTRHLDFVSWPKGGKPGSREQQQHTERPQGESPIPLREQSNPAGKEISPWTNR